MSGTTVKSNENIDNVLKRFKRETAKAGTMQEVRKREHHVGKSMKRKLKSEAARKKSKKSGKGGGWSGGSSY